MNGVGIEFGRDGHFALAGKFEAVRECVDGSGDSIAARTAQLDQVVRRREGDHKPSAIAQNAPEGALHRSAP